MPTLNITTSYQDGEVLTEAQLDEVVTQVEAHYNITGLEGSDLLQGKINGASKIANANITGAKLVDSAVDSRIIEDGFSNTNGIATSSIQNSAVTNIKLDSNSIQTADLQDASVTISKLADNAIPKEAVPDIGIVSIPVPNLNHTGSGYATIGTLPLSNLNVGRPLIISLESSSTIAPGGYIGLYTSRGVENMSGVNTYRISGCKIALFRDSVQISTFSIISDREYSYQYWFPELSRWPAYSKRLMIPLSSISFVDTPSSTSHVYSFKIAITGVSDVTPSGPTNVTTGATVVSAKIKAIHI